MKQSLMDNNKLRAEIKGALKILVNIAHGFEQRNRRAL
jgi:hypothetical protein